MPDFARPEGVTKLTKGLVMDAERMTITMT